MKKLKCIMLIDDDEDDNFFHALAAKEADVCETIHIAESAFHALDNMRDTGELPEIIFVDINMPKMNGWEFVEEYAKLELAKKSSSLIYILTTSPNPLDVEKARKSSFITGFRSKPLTAEMLKEITEIYWAGMGSATGGH